MLGYKYLKTILFCFPAEFCHDLSIVYLNNCVKAKKIKQDPILNQNLLGLQFESPIGLAAGYDKNAQIFDKSFGFNFGFAECGTVTPKPQSGNVKPRLFRLTKDQAIINRFGFNNVGKKQFLKNYRKGKKHLDPNFPIGINIGKNKDQIDNIADYLDLIEFFYPYANYLTINISSPNTKGLRDIQTKENLELLMTKVNKLIKNLKENNNYAPPILYKIAPDQSENSLQDICDLALQYQIDGMIISNTTISRPKSLKSKYKNEIGGLSGKPLNQMANKLLGEILGPVSAPIFRLKKKYRMRLLVRGSKKLKLQDSISMLIANYKFSGGIKLSVDVDPINFN